MNFPGEHDPREFKQIVLEVGRTPVQFLVNARKWHVAELLEEIRKDGQLGATLENVVTVDFRGGNIYSWKATEASRLHGSGALAFHLGAIPLGNGAKEWGALDLHPDTRKITGGPREIAYTKVQGQRVEIIKNPTRSDVRQMEAETRDELQRVTPDTELVRFYGHAGNIYCWHAHLATHSDLGVYDPLGFGAWFDRIKSM